MPSILQAFKKKSRFFYALILLLALSNSALNIGLLAFINNILSDERLAIFYFNGWMYYVGLVVISLVVNKLFQTYLTRLTNNLLYEIEVNLLDKVRKATLQSFEMLGSQRVYTAMGDIQVIGRLPNQFVTAFNAVITVVCCLIFLFMISPAGMFSLLGMMAVLLVFYLVRNRQIMRSLNTLRSMMNDYFRYLNDLLLGFREMRMSSVRNNNIYFNYLRKNRRECRELSYDTAIRYLNNELVGGYSWYVVLGILLFVLPKLFVLGAAQIVSMLFVVLYMMGPVAVLVSMIQVYSHVRIAMQRLSQFERDADSKLTEEVVATAPLPVFNGPFRELEFTAVTFRYQQGGGQQEFAFGPVSLHIKKGETLFITGGNGSGKSTFVNLLTGLYKPLSGQVHYNGAQIGEDQYPAYHQQFAAIFSNNYLFRENYDEFDLSAGNASLGEYLDWLRMRQVVRHTVSGAFVTDMSRGQQKRLALVNALLEDKDILVLDEWAAEQEPGFRAYFYETLLPRLKAAGKTLIVVTHDDRFFSCADRIIQFEYGKLADEVSLLHPLINK